jgi:hypothetical protein
MKKPKHEVKNQKVKKNENAKTPKKKIISNHGSPKLRGIPIPKF